jgi:hypothetical protein
MTQSTQRAAAPIPNNTNTVEQFREVFSRAACLASLATAANTITEGDAIGDDYQRRNVVADILEVIRLLSRDLSESNLAAANEAEKRGADNSLAATATPASNPLANTVMPGAWYDLLSRVSAAQSLASCALEALPDGLTGNAYERVNHACNLLAALQDILRLTEQDVNLLEVQLKS